MTNEGTQNIVLAYNKKGDVQISKKDFNKVLKLAGEMLIMADEDDEFDNDMIICMGKYAATVEHILFKLVKENGELIKEDGEEQEDDEPCKYSA